MAFSRKRKLSNIGRIIKQHRVMSGLTLRQLSQMSDVSSSHLAHIERGERFPSAHVLRNLFNSKLLAHHSKKHQCA